MATIALAPEPTPLRRRILRNGSRLFAKKTVDLVNVAATADLARALRQWAESLKPDILQVPTENDDNAREQANVNKEYTQLANAIAEKLSQSEEGTPNEFTEECLVLLGEFNQYLSDTDDELQGLRDESLVVKFSHQEEFKQRLETKKEETLKRVVMFCFKNGLLVNSTVAQSQTDIQRLTNLVNQNTERTSRFENQQLGSDEMIRQLVAREVNAVLQDWQTDRQCCAICIVFSREVFFFT